MEQPYPLANGDTKRLRKNFQHQVLLSYSRLGVKVQEAQGSPLVQGALNYRTVHTAPTLTLS